MADDHKIAKKKFSELKETINKKYKRSVVSVAKKENKKNRFSTGSFNLDYAIGGGISQGLVAMIYGEESTSKTTIALKVLADAQRRDRTTHKYIDHDELISKKYKYDEENDEYTKRDKPSITPYRCAFVDLEGSFDEAWFSNLGGIPEKIEYIAPDYGEQAADIIMGILESRYIDMIVVDSIAHFIPKDEMEASAESQTMGLQARLVNKFVRNLTSRLNVLKQESVCPTIILINQVRKKIGVMFGPDETKPGGLGQNFLPSLIIRTRKGKVYHLNKEDNYPLYVEMRGNIEKNKAGPPKIAYEFNLALNPYDPNLNEGDKKYEVAFKKGDILEHKTVIKFATDFSIFMKDEAQKKYCVSLYGEEPICYDKKAELLDQWVYNNQRNFLKVKEEILRRLCGN
jgi:recombination protein RecA